MTPENASIDQGAAFPLCPLVARAAAGDFRFRHWIMASISVIAGTRDV